MKQIIPLDSKIPHVSMEDKVAFNECLLSMVSDNPEFIYGEIIEQVADLEQDSVESMLNYCVENKILLVRYELICPREEVPFFYTFDKELSEGISSEECNCTERHHQLFLCEKKTSYRYNL